MNRKLLKLFAFFILNITCAQQKTPIENDSVLYPFFEKLQRLEKTGDKIINIVHIGDSHLQAGLMPEQIRTLSQKRFGNAGYGFVFPYSLSKTNGTDVFSFESNTEWTSQRMVFKNLGYPTGLSGIAFFTETPEFYLKITTASDNYKFNRVKVITPKNQKLFQLKENLNEVKAQVHTEIFTNTYLFPHLSNQLYLTPEKTYEKYALNGLILENGNPGILYHSIGVNGAKFLDYNKYPLFFEQLRALDPDVLIISLGTNEAFDKAAFTTEDFRNQMDEFFANLKLNQIDIPLLITTPPPALINKKDINPKVIEFRNELIKRSLELNYATWDLYMALGTYDNISNLIKNNLLSNDRIHYTEKGYKLQGDFFVEAFFDSYDNYKK